MKFKTAPLISFCKGNGSYGIAASAVDFSPDLPTYLRITDINDDGTLNLNALKSVDDPEAEKYYLSPNDIVFARTGASTGRNYFYDGHDGKFVYAGFLIKFSIDPEKVNPLFIKYFCQSPNYYGWIASFSTGSTRGNINAQTLANMPIPVLERKQQDLLADTLSSLDKLISENKKINRNLEEQAKAIFKSWFVDFEPFQNGKFVDSELGKIPEGWQVRKFTDVIQVLGGGTPKTSQENFWNGDIPFFTPKDVGNSIYVMYTEKTLTQAGIDNCNSKLYPINTVFVTARGTVGKIALAGVPMAMNQSCYALVGKNISSFFILHLTYQTINRLKNKASGAVFDAIVTRDFDSEQIIFPPTEIIEKFVALVQNMYEHIRNNELQQIKLAQMRDTLLPKLMSGEIDVLEV